MQVIVGFIYLPNQEMVVFSSMIGIIGLVARKGSAEGAVGPEDF
jgi:hypothetical protein